MLLRDSVYHAIDEKAKRTPAAGLGRVRNIESNPLAAFLIDHYEDDWGRLWYTLLRGDARLLQSGGEHDEAIRALRRKYRQYRETIPLSKDALVIALDVRQLSDWQASSGGRRRAARPGRQA